MAADFVPLTARLAPRTAAPTGESFIPLGAPAAPASAQHPECRPEPGEVRVEVKRDGQRITRITIHCRCGDVIDLDCEY
jgi:hypothetical protein